MSDETDYEALEKSVKYIPWKGKKTEWYMWHKTFLVRAMIRGYHGVLVGLEAIPSDDTAKKLAVLSDLTPSQKKQYNNYKMNTRAYADLLQCCTQDIVSFGIVDTAKDEDLKNGNTALAWKRLSEKYAGRNNAEKMKLIKQLNESRMKKNEDPDVWITNLERLRQRIAECGKTIDDNELIMHILYNLPSVYDNINDQYMKELDNAKDIQLEDLRADLRRKYDRLLDQGNINKTDDNNEEEKIIKEEKALKTVFKKQFKGKCRICGKIGHKGADCWTVEANKDKRPTNYNRKENVTTKNFSGNCNYCHKKGHRESECYTKQNDNANNVEEEHALMTSYCAHKEDTEMWIGDTGATCHMKSTTEGMYDLEICRDVKIDTANGSTSTVTHVGKYKGNVLCSDGKTKKIVMKNVKVVPGLVKNLFSLSTVMRNDWDLLTETKNNVKILKIKKGDIEYEFDKKVSKNSNGGYLMGMQIEPAKSEETKKMKNEKTQKLKKIENEEKGNLSLEKGAKIDINDLHEKLGHPAEEMVKLTGNYMKLSIRGKMDNCENCAIGKMRQKNVEKGPKEKSPKPGFRFYIDIALSKFTSAGGSKYWFLAVDEATHMKFSLFLKQKSDVKDKFIPLLKELRDTYGRHVDHIRCDNAGENQALESACIDKELGIVFEYTAPGTPQQNGVVERAFATMLGKTRAIMNGAGFDEKKRHLFWTEAANTITHLENITIRKGNTRTPYYLFYGKDAPYTKYLQVFGQLGIVKVLQPTNKLSDKGLKAIFVGYANKHAGNVYRFVNPNTNRIILSRDVKWLSKRYGEEKNVKPLFVPTKWDDISDDDEETIKESEDEEEIMTSTQIGLPIESSREMRRLDIGQQIMTGRTRQQTRDATRDATQLVEENLDDFYQDCALMSAIVTGQNNEPKTFQEAWYHNDQEKRKKWRTVIRKEFRDMIKRGVWVNVNRSSIPEGRKLIGSKWVFKEKRDGRFRARLVCLGYSLVKHSRPDLSNGTRELSKVMDKATEGHMKELCRMIKYALDTRHIGLKLKPEENDNKLWELKAYSDADFAGDKETRISVTGYVVYFMSVPVCWRSRGQKSVTLSTTEAEYVACSEVVKEVLFILQLLKHLQVELQLPIRVHVDNIGAIFLAENQNSSDRTKHVDTRYHFVRQYIKDGTVLIEFVRSHDNDSDIFTKNTTSEVHHRHSEKLTWTKEEYESEASRITTGRVLRGIVNHSYSKLQRNSDWNESQIEDNRLSNTNHYEVLEKYDEVENEVEIGTKVQFE